MCISGNQIYQYIQCTAFNKNISFTCPVASGSCGAGRDVCAAACAGGGAGGNCARTCP